MAHLSLYREFRPVSFDGMVRQEHIVQVLKNQIATDSIGHAYLFCGPRGTGKTTIARIFAKAVNCEHPVNGSPCGKCATCQSLSDGASLDICEIDAASNNGVNEMRELREKVQYPPVTGRYKVYIIDEVHMLTDSAFNALLKTLEEPPRHVIFVLATTEPQKIPATILSRCMRLDFKLIPQEDLEKHLKSILTKIGKPYEDEAVSAIAQAGAGSDRDMLSIAEMCISYSDKLTYEGVMKVLGTADFEEMNGLLFAILSGNLALSLEKTEKILSEGKSVGVLLKDIRSYLNQLAIAKVCKNGEKLLAVPPKIYQKISDLAEKADGHAILRATEIFADAENNLRGSTSPRICLETAVFKASCPASDYDIDALLSRVSALESEVKKLQSGVSVAVTSTPVQEEPKKEIPKKAVEEVDYDFPTEEVVFDEYIPFEEPIEPKQVEKPVMKAEEKPVHKEEPKKEEKKVSVNFDGDPVVLFGRFMRMLRKTSPNGVLYLMCSDLEAEFDGDTLVLMTDSDSVLRSLSKPEHQTTMKTVFEEIGVAEFEVRKKGQPKKINKEGIESIKRDFADYPVELK